MAEDLARIAPPPGGGKARWEVREDADERLLAVKFPDQLSTDFKALSERQRRQLLQRRQILREWEVNRKAGLARNKRPIEIAAAYVAELAMREKPVKLSVRTLYRWEENYRADGINGLLDDRPRRNVEGEARRDDPFLQEVQRLYFRRNAARSSSVTSWRSTRRRRRVGSFTPTKPLSASSPSFPPPSSTSSAVARRHT